MSRTTYALLAIAPEIIALVIIVRFGLRKRRELKEFEQKIRSSMDKTYALGKDYITCLVCGRTSYNGNDIQMKYCGNCHQFHEP
jgi:ribosomal protein L37E